MDVYVITVQIQTLGLVNVKPLTAQTYRASSQVSVRVAIAYHSRHFGDDHLLRGVVVAMDSRQIPASHRTGEHND